MKFKKNYYYYYLVAKSIFSKAVTPGAMILFLCSLQQHLDHCSMLRFFSDISGFLSTSIITGHNLRPDLLLSLSNKSRYILELTVGYKSNLRSYAERKKQIYRELVQQLKNDYEKVNFVNFSISALGIYDKSTAKFMT